MIFTETKLKGTFIIEPERLEDERGFFARTWCKREFELHGLNADLVQCNISYNKKKGALRGMHFQKHPHEEAKLVRCTKGAIYDVIIDLRKNSPTYTNWFSIELTANNHKLIYVPEGFAHGFQTLLDDTEVFYQMSEYYYPEYMDGIRWNDHLFNIKWPESECTISARDKKFPDFSP